MRRTAKKTKYVEAESSQLSAGQALRHQLMNRLTPIMLGSGSVEDRQLRSQIEASCADMVRTLESVIEDFGLDEYQRCENRSRAA